MVLGLSTWTFRVWVPLSQGSMQPYIVHTWTFEGRPTSLSMSQILLNERKYVK